LHLALQLDEVARKVIPRVVLGAVLAFHLSSKAHPQPVASQ